jgi:hypothetical protein
VADAARPDAGIERRSAQQVSGKAPAMAYRTVQLVIGQILTDEELREKFLDEPLETLTTLRDNGVDLTKSEIDALLVTDPRLWHAGSRWLDSRLQRCRLCGFTERKRH